MDILYFIWWQDNCVVKTLSDHMKSLNTSTFKKAWGSMKSFQKSLSSHIQLNRLFNNITEVEDLVNETESEAKCTKSLTVQQIPESLILFANQKQLKREMDNASPEQKHSMFRIIRKFKQGCKKNSMFGGRRMKPDEEERELRKPDLTTVASCDNLADDGEWKLNTADDVADKMTCSLYEHPKKLVELCEPLAQLKDEERDAVMEHTLRSPPYKVPLSEGVEQIYGPREQYERPQAMENIAETMAKQLKTISANQSASAHCVMKHIPIDELKKAPFLSKIENKKAFCQQMATTDHTNVNLTEVNAKLKFCSEVGVPMTEQGELLVSADPEDLAGVTADELIDNPQMSYFICRLDSLQQMANKLAEIYGKDLAKMDASALSAMLPLLLGLEEPSDCLTIYRSNYGDILEALKKIMNTCMGDIVEAAKKRLARIVDLCEDDNLYTDMGESPSRRKRSAQYDVNVKLYNCKEVMEINPVSRSVGYLSQLSCDVFLPTSDCLAELTDVDGYSFEQLQQLAKRFFKCNSGSQIAADMKSQLCVIMLGITNVTQLNNILFTSEFNIECSGSKTNTRIKSDQMTAFFMKYLKDNDITSVSGLTKEHIAEMGIILCGIPVKDIAEFKSYSEMASIIDTYQCFDDDQLKAWADKNMETFGKDIDPASMERLYYVAAGLSDEIYSKFTDAHVQSILDPVFSKISAKKLNLLTISALCAISKNQAANIPEKVMELLSNTAHDVITSIMKEMESELCQQIDEEINGKPDDDIDEPDDGEKPGFGGEDGGSEKPGFGGEDGGSEKPGFGGEDDGSEKPGFGGDDGDDEKPGFGGEDGDDEKPGFGGEDGDDEKPDFGGEDGGSDKPGFGGEDGDDEKPGFGGEDGGGEKPGFGGEDGGGEKPGFGGEDGDGEKPGFGGGDADDEKPGFGGEDGDGRKPDFGGEDGGGEKPGFGGEDGDGEKPGFGGGDGDGEKPGFGGEDGDGEKPGFGGENGDGEKPGFGGEDGDGRKPSFGDGEKPDFGGGDGDGEKPGFGGGDGDGEKPGFGGENGNGEKPGFGGEDGDGRKPGFGDGEKPGFGGEDSDGRKPDFGGEDGDGRKPSFGGEHGDGEKSGFGDGEKPGFGGDDGDGRKPSFGGEHGDGEKSGFGDGEKPGFGGEDSDGRKPGFGGEHGDGEKPGFGGEVVDGEKPSMDFGHGDKGVEGMGNERGGGNEQGDGKGKKGGMGSSMPGMSSGRSKPPTMDLDQIEEYKPMPSTYDFGHAHESLGSLTAEDMKSVDVHRVPTSSIKDLDDESILAIGEDVCDSPDQDKKAFVKSKIRDMYKKLNSDQIRRVMGCVPVDMIETADATTLLPMMKESKIGKDTPQSGTIINFPWSMMFGSGEYWRDPIGDSPPTWSQAQMMAEKTTDIMKNALSGKEGPPPGEILQAAGSVLCLMPTKIFQEAVDAVHDQPDLLKELMQNYTANCGNRDPLRVKLLADSLSKTVTLKNKTKEQLKEAMINNTEAVCSASQELKNLPDDDDLLETAMAHCAKTRKQMASRGSTSFKNLQKFFTQTDGVSSNWQQKFRKHDWSKVDVSKEGVLDYFVPLMKSDYENITKPRVCTDQKLPDVLGYPQVALGSMMYYFCKEEYKNDFAKYKQLGIHAPNSEIKKYASPADVRNLKKAIYMVPKAKFTALSEVANKDFNPKDSSTFQNAQYTMIGLPMSKFNETKEEDRGILCDMMACNAITALSSEDIEEKLTFCKKYLNWENFLCAHSPAIKEQFMVAASGLTMKTIDKLNTTCSEINDNLVGLAAAVTSCDVRKWLYDCAKENGRGFAKKDDLDVYSQLVDQISSEDFDMISDENKCSMWTDVIREESKRRTDLIDFRMNINSAISQSGCYGVNNTVTIEYVLAMKKSCDKFNRRKRETSGLTCSEFLSYGNNREFLVSAKDISSMAKEEFEECIIDIGGTSGFQTEHWQAAAEIAKQIYGDVSTWTSQTLKDIGGITSGLSINDMKKLKLTDLEAASVVGSNGAWDNAKLATAFANFKKDYLDDDMANINATHLMAISELNCGATSEDITNIKPIVYCDAADKIGSLKYCEPSQKQAYVRLAKDPVCFGNDIGAWSPDSIRLLGSQLGGLEHDDIPKLNGDQLMEIDRLAIEELPPNIVNAFSLDQLQMFDPDQVSVFTPEQMQSLDPEKRQVVKQKQETTKSNDDQENDAVLFSSSVLLLIVTFVMNVLHL
ncbi:hypothetical protein LSH36_364g02062 [Paralvinella palmiformis]|uniref:Uncharacterized protein n=1 Tax=Paralvinella palmiformis TaxID=53620 RepID=A0AAD9JF03_9ANNE|nr:hypothetical protein LSH36_364g02062 [Paralvinella palmiformis]